MSVHSDVKRRTIPELMAFKGKQKIVALTAYVAHIARQLDP